MKDRVELKYTDLNGWQLIVENDLVGKQAVDLPNDMAMIVALAVSTARRVGIKEGQDRIKKRYKGIIDAYLNWQAPEPAPAPWEDANKPTYWNPDWKLNDPRK